MRKTVFLTGAVLALGLLIAGCSTDGSGTDPELTGAVTITRTATGAVQVGEVLTANVGFLDGTGAPSFQWFRGAAAIPGANANTYTVVAADEGHSISVEVARSGYSGSRRSGSVGPVVLAPGAGVPALGGTITVTGTPAVGQTLTANTASLTHEATGTFSFQWLRGSTAIPGANANTYAVVAADSGQRISVTVTRSGHSGSVTSAPTAAVPLYLSGQVWQFDIMTGSDPNFTGNVQLTWWWGGAEPPTGSITNGQLSFAVPTPPDSVLWSMADFIADYDGMGGFPENAVVSDPAARITTLRMYAADGSGAVSRMHIISHNLQGGTITGVMEEVTYMFVDRPVTVSSTGWSDNFGTESAFSISLNEGWNTILRRVQITISEESFTGNVTSTTIANPDNMRWYWESWGD